MNIQSTICPSRTRPRFLRFFCNIPSSYLMLRVPGGESHVVNCHRRFDDPSFNHFFFSQKCYVLTISFALFHVYLAPNQSRSRIKWVPFFGFFSQPYRLHMCCTRTADTKPTPNRNKGVEVEKRLVKWAPRRWGECLFCMRVHLCI